MNILGFNCYGHDSAAAILKDGVLVSAVEEERLNRKKHSGLFPINSINYVLENSNLKISDIDHITYAWDPKIALTKIPIYLWNYWRTIPILLRESKELSMQESFGAVSNLANVIFLPKLVKKSFPTPDKYKHKFHFLEHHMCHAASCFYPTKFEDAAILTVDGAGEWATTMMAHGNGNKINKILTIDTPYSLGAFYQAISRYMGFKYAEGPGKLMGLASYGKRNTNEYRLLREAFHLLPDGRFEIDMSYFSYHYSRHKRGVSDKFFTLFGEAQQEGSLDWSNSKLNIAAAAQQIVEEVIFHILKNLKDRTNSKNLCMAGGVALNSVTNGLIARSGLFENIFIQPAAGDSGTSLGSALLLNHNKFDNKRNFIQKNSFLGPSYSDYEYKLSLDENSISYQHYSNDQIYPEVAKLISEGKIVGWMQDKMEFGPRALGNRSFLASPLVIDMKDILNRRVKFRESFRPFAAIVLEEDAGKYFDFNYKNPYMLMVFNVKPEFRSILPAITHVDNTVRIQTVNKEENPSLYELLCEFKKLTGYSILVNTSFNIKGEPIICSPKDAVKSFKAADIDALVLGNYISLKNKV